MRRNTIQKELVLNTVRKLKTHSTADEIYAEIAKGYPSIGRGTVYRNLNILAEEDQIRKIEIPGGADEYDFMTANHYHARCTKCNKVFDVDIKPVDGLLDKIENTNGMTFSSYDIVFKGICSECKEQ